MARSKPDDCQVRIGEWVFYATRNTLYVHHAEQPGDISIEAKPMGYKIEVSNDGLDLVNAKLEVPYEGLGPKVG